MEPMGVAGARAPESAEAQRPSGVVALGLGEHLRHGATPQFALTRTRSDHHQPMRHHTISRHVWPTSTGPSPLLPQSSRSTPEGHPGGTFDTILPTPLGSCAMQLLTPGTKFDAQFVVAPCAPCITGQNMWQAWMEGSDDGEYALLLKGKNAFDPSEAAWEHGGMRAKTIASLMDSFFRSRG